jgi:uncharacterized protein YhfF
MNVKEMWASFNSGLNRIDSYTSWHFCDNEKDANELLELVLEGRKRGTASVYELYEKENEKLPEVGDYSVITNWLGEPRCIIKTTNVNILSFSRVSEGFAYKEGEGDRGLKHWKKVHWEVFGRSMDEHGLKVQESTLVVCEEFELVYK